MFFESTCPVEFKTGLSEIVEFSPRGTKAKNHIFRGSLLDKVLFLTMKMLLGHSVLKIGFFLFLSIVSLWWIIQVFFECKLESGKVKGAMTKNDPEKDLEVNLRFTALSTLVDYRIKKAGWRSPVCIRITDNSERLHTICTFHLHKLYCKLAVNKVLSCLRSPQNTGNIS